METIDSKMHGPLRCVSGLPGQTCMACDTLKSFEVSVYFAGVSGANALASASHVIEKIRENPETPIFAWVSWSDASGRHEKLVKVTRQGARFVEDDEPLPVQ